MTTVDPGADYGDDLNWRRKWAPTPKWSVATVAATVTGLTLLVEAGWHWSNEIVITTVGLVGQRVASDIAPNHGG